MTNCVSSYMVLSTSNRDLTDTTMATCFVRLFTYTVWQCQMLPLQIDLLHSCPQLQLHKRMFHYPQTWGSQLLISSESVIGNFVGLGYFECVIGHCQDTTICSHPAYGDQVQGYSYCEVYYTCDSVWSIANSYILSCDCDIRWRNRI